MVGKPAAGIGQAWVIAAFLLCAFPIHAFAAEAGTVDYGREVRPIFARRCYACHGPTKAEGGLRLDQHEPALAELDSGDHAIVAKDPEASVLLTRVAAEDDSERMPPEGAPLSLAEIDTLRRWIEQGAPWADHWAFRPRVRPRVPTITNADWAENPIDAFVWDRLERAGLRPAPEADRRTLIRRATMDLTGLPPTPEEVRVFVDDPDPNAYANLVDRLLQSPHYGEKWGRHWLDLVRYADTNSFERDAAKPHAWRFRDYVIRSFNEDKPFDQFVREQLAGDELDQPTDQSLIATGYYRLGLWDDEPSDPEQLKFDCLDDLVKTTSQVFMGLTMDCARCHDHKIDPISQRDYYQMVSFFHNITPMRTSGAEIERPVFATVEEQADFNARHAEWRRGLEVVQEGRLADERAFAALLPVDQELVPRFDLDTLQFAYYEGKWNDLPDFAPLTPITTGSIADQRLDLSPRRRDADFGIVFTANLRVPNDGDFEFTARADQAARIVIDGTEVLRVGGVSPPKEIAEAASPVPGNGAAANTPSPAAERTCHVFLTGGRHPLRIEFYQGGERFDLMIGWRRVGEAEFRPLTADDIRRPAPPYWPLVESDGAQVFSAAVHRIHLDRIARQTKLLRDEPKPPLALCVTEPGPNPPPTYILTRGNPHAPSTEVQPSFPTILGGELAAIPPATTNRTTSGRRRALADWLVRPEHPLTARVLANRIWQHHFGKGIVKSSNNFGFGGDSPTHPELLDWLAEELISNGWRLKALHREIMDSRTYRMSAVAAGPIPSQDPGNSLLWRFDLRRMSAEELRDSILAVNGALNPQRGGPGFFTPIPAAVLATQSQPGNGWGTSSEDQVRRRSVYIHVKRSLLTPLLESFDLAETDNSCPVRFVTTQPTQALGLLNSDYLQDQAEIFAARLEREFPDDSDARIERAFWLVAARAPSAEEARRARALVSDLVHEYGKSPHEALTQFCLLMLNLNEFIHID